MIKKLVPLALLGVLIVCAVALAQQPTVGARPTQVTGVVKGVDATASTFQLQAQRAGAAPALGATALLVRVAAATAIYLQTPATKSDFAVGAWVRIIGQRTPQGALQATGLVLLPQTLQFAVRGRAGRPPRRPRPPAGGGVGQIASLNPFTVKLRNGQDVQPVISPKTRLMKLTFGGFADIQVGASARATGRIEADGSLLARQVFLLPQATRKPR